MTLVNIHEAKTQLSALLVRMAAGEDIVIAKAGKAVARLVPFEAPRVERKPGLWAGQIWVAPDFDEWPEGFLASFEGEGS